MTQGDFNEIVEQALNNLDLVITSHPVKEDPVEHETYTKFLETLYNNLGLNTK